LNFKRFKSTFILILFLVIRVSALEYMPLSFAWAGYVDLLVQRGHLRHLNACVRPFKVSDILDAVKKQDVNRLSPREHEWMDLIHRELRYAGGSPDTSPNINGAGRIQGIGSMESSDVSWDYDLKAGIGARAGIFSGFTGIRSIYSYKDDSTYPWKRDRFTAGRVDEAYMDLHSKYLDLFIGRMDRNWGPLPERSLFLSSNPYSFDQVALRLHRGRFALNQVCARLDDGVERFPPNRVANRFFSTHRLDIKIKCNINIGLCESIVYGGHGRMPEIRYLNPFGVYLFSQINSESRGNSMIGFDFLITRLWNFNFYGQVAVDDFQVDNEDAGDEEPPIYGFYAGVDYLFKDIKFSLLHQHLSDYLYNVQRYYERYTIIDKGIGEPGNDRAETSLSVEYLGVRDLVVKAGYSLIYRGGPTDSRG
jgi:hypothetical protein